MIEHHILMAARRNQLFAAFRALRDLFDERKDRAGFVYIATNEHREGFKIGFSRNPKRRLEEQRLHPVAILEGSLGLEWELHQMFADRRIRGEWFRLAPVGIEHCRSIWGVRM